MLIPESRKQPLTESLLYKQIIRFFEQEKIRDRFEIVFITIANGIVISNQQSVTSNQQSVISKKLPVTSYQLPINSYGLPSKNFRSGRTLVSKEQINQMADSIVEYTKTQKHKNTKIIVAYCRGAYLEAVRLANKKLQATSYKLPAIQEFFSDDELAQLKKKGIMWMKVGLRMPTPFIIFRMKIKELVKKDENRQLKLF